MKEEEFWKLIKKSKWKSDFSYNRISDFFMDENNISIEDRKDFVKFIEKFKHDLHVYFDKIYEDSENQYDKYIGESDDGLSDLIAHIIGLGKTTYYSCLKDFKKAGKYSRAKAKIGNKRVENFLYSTHRIIDYYYENKEFYEKIEEKNKIEEKINKLNQNKEEQKQINSNLDIIF